MIRRLLIFMLVCATAVPALAQEPPTGSEDENPRPTRRRRPPRRVQPSPDETTPVPAVPAAPTPAAPSPAPAAPLPGVVPPITAPPVPAVTPATPTVVSPGGAGTAPGGENPGEDSALYQCRQFKPNARIKVTLKPDTDLKDLVAWVMGFTCKSFIFGNAISGRASKVTIIAPSEMSPQDAYRLFLVGLQTMNLTVVPKGRTLEIVESQRGREMPLPVYKSAASVPGQDQIVRVVLRPEHVSPDELSQVLNAMKTGTGTVTPIPAAGVVIITDYGSTIDKMTEVVKEVDAQTGAEKIYIIYLTNADAQDIAQKLEQIFGMGRGGAPGAGAAPQIQAPQPGQPNAPRPTRGAGNATQGGNAAPSKIIADTRTNSLIVIASERAYQRILALVRRLDTGGPTETGSIHVYALANADAEALAGTMNTLITGQAPPQRQGQQPGQPPRQQPAAVAQAQAAGATAAAFEGQIKLTHDKPTNSLVIVSSPKDFFSLREVIRKLDQPRRQVFVEATILEVSLQKRREIGFSFHGGDQISTDDGDVTILGGVQAAAVRSLNPTSAISLDGLIGAVIGPQIPGLSIPSLGVLFQLLQANNEVNVLSSPNILTTDNEPAEISVGQNIPYQSATFSGLGSLGGIANQQGQNQTNPLAGLGGLGQSIQRQDVALTLKLTPHVSDADIVRLEVDLEISDVLPESGQLGPSWSKRRVKTPIVVRDQQPVVIGGLMSDSVSVTETKVPILGDIPLLGYLFKYEKREKKKTNLLIFLTPYVIKDLSDLQSIFEQKVRERREFVDAYSSLEDREIDPFIDYKRKRGLLEEINKAILTADDDERMMREALQNRSKLGQEGPVELPEMRGDGGESGPDPGGGEAPPPPPPPPEGE